MIAIAVWVALVAALACVPVRGGAVELSWLLRDFEGENTDCTTSRVRWMRVCWVPVDLDAGRTMAECTTVRVDAGLRELSRDFPCDEQRGVTRFELPSGPNAIFVRPVCASASDPTEGTVPPDGTFQVPPPIVRTVETGEVVTLNQLLVVVDDDCSDGTCTCPPDTAPAPAN